MGHCGTGRVALAERADASPFSLFAGLGSWLEDVFEDVFEDVCDVREGPTLDPGELFLNLFRALGSFWPPRRAFPMSPRTFVGRCGESMRRRVHAESFIDVDRAYNLAHADAADVGPGAVAGALPPT